MNTSGPSAAALANLRALQSAEAAAASAYAIAAAAQTAAIAAAQAAVDSARAARQDYEKGIWRNNTGSAETLDENYSSSVAGQAWFVANEWSASLPPSAAQIAQLTALKATEAAAAAALVAAVAVAQTNVSTQLSALQTAQAALVLAQQNVNAGFSRGVSGPSVLDEGAGATRPDVYS